MTPTRLTVIALALSSAVAAAGDKPEVVKKQLATATANVKAAKLTVAHAETDHLLVFAPGTEDKAKSAAATFEKAYTSAAKSLKVGADEKLWTGKLAVYVLPETRQFRGFLLEALKRAPQGRESYVFELRRDDPFVAAGTGLGEKPSDAEVTAEAAGLVAAAVLTAKGGTATFPDWLLRGFGRAAHLRADGGATRLSAFRTKVKGLYTKTRGAPFKPAVVYDPMATGPDVDTLTTSFVEYLAFGPEAEKFPKVVQALKPSEEAPNPTVATALAAVEWTPEAIEAGWKKWVMTGK